MNFFLEATPIAKTSNFFIQSVPLIFLGIIFYFLLIRPQQKQRRNHQKLIDSLKHGDHVILNSGIHGLITNIKEKTVLVKVADNVKIEFEKSAITAVSAVSTSSPQSTEIESVK